MKTCYTIIIFFATFQAALQAQVTGMWKTIGDVDGTEKSIMEIYERGGKIYGKVVKLLPAAAHTVCENVRAIRKTLPLQEWLF